MRTVKVVERILMVIPIMMSVVYIVLRRRETGGELV